MSNHLPLEIAVDLKTVSKTRIAPIIGLIRCVNIYLASMGSRMCNEYILVWNINTCVYNCTYGILKWNTFNICDLFKTLQYSVDVAKLQKHLIFTIHSLPILWLKYIYIHQMHTMYKRVFDSKPWPILWGWKPRSAYERSNRRIDWLKKKKNIYIYTEYCRVSC